MILAENSHLIQRIRDLEGEMPALASKYAELPLRGQKGMCQTSCVRAHALAASRPSADGGGIFPS